jgi:uncharacterized protein YkwD
VTDSPGGGSSFSFPPPAPPKYPSAGRPKSIHARPLALDYELGRSVLGAMARFPRATRCGSALALGVLVGCGDVPLDVVVSQSAATGDQNVTGGSSGVADGSYSGDAGAAFGGAGAAGASGNGNQSSTTTGGSGSQDTPDVPATSVCEPYASWNDTWVALEETALALINERRASGAACPSMSTSPVPAFEFDPALRCAARLHSLDMVTRDFFSQGTWDEGAPMCASDGDCGAWQICDARVPGESPERCLDGTSVRLDNVGWTGRAWAELISGGSETAAAAVEYWMGSPGTCAMVMAADRTQIGIGYAAGGPYDHTWTVVTGSY